MTEMFEDDIRKCINTLTGGGTILYPTDTVWGLGCDAMDPAAVEKIYALKRRPASKSMIVLLADARDVLQYIAAPPPDIITILESFMQPTTVIYPGALYFPENVINDDGSVAVRVTKDPFCKALIKRLRRPLVSTSANVSGAVTPATFSEIGEEIKSGADYVVRWRQDDEAPRAPSRIVRLDDEGRVEVIR